MRGRIHCNQERCTLVFGSQDYQVFKLDEDTNEAFLILDHSPSNDIRFINLDSQVEGNFVLGNLHQDEEDAALSRVHGYDRYQIDLIDLDQPVSTLYNPLVHKNSAVLSTVVV